VIAQEWLPGEPLLACLQKTIPHNARWVGEALAALHAHCYRKLATTPADRMSGNLAGLALDVAFVWPTIKRRATALAAQLARRLVDGRSEVRPTHGDFYAKQVLVSGDQVAFLDLDDAAMDEAEIDLGNFIAHLELEALRGRLTPSQVAEASDAFVEGYASLAGSLNLERIRIHTAAALFRLLPRPFRSRLPDWPEQTEAILNRAESLASDDAGTRRPSAVPRARGRFDRVSDPFGALADPALPMLEAAVNPETAERAIAEALEMSVAVRRTRITRHKAGRRCVIEYDVETHSGASTWIGKMRARGCDGRTAQVQAALERSGFDRESATGVSVPHVIGCVTPLRLWLQEKVPGRSVADLLAQDEGARVAADAVRAVRQLHSSPVVPSRSHQLDDELRVLDERLAEVGNLIPAWRSRLKQLMAGCRNQARRLAPQPVRHLHRDFYADQVIVNQGRVYLLDLDTYAAGDEALDAGNFLAHVIESRLRAPNGTGPSPAVDAAIVAGCLAGRSCGIDALDFYTTVALARLVHVSTRLPERRPFTSRILEAVEARLCGVYATGQATAAPT
jgi:streptomycin 6-kinase